MPNDSSGSGGTSRREKARQKLQSGRAMLERHRKEMQSDMEEEQGILQDLRSEIASPQEQQKEKVKGKMQAAFDSKGGFRTSADDFGRGVEQPLLDEAVDYPAGGLGDGDLFDRIGDPVDEVDMMAGMDVDTTLEEDFL